MRSVTDPASLRVAEEHPVSRMHGILAGVTGRIGILGGSLEYTGAPYFVGTSALRCGADLAHVFCAREAAVPIKSYSPELIVHPAFRLEDLPDPCPQEYVSEAFERILPWIGRMDVFVVGPGLGRSSLAQGVAARLLEKLRQDGTPVVLDADGLWLLTQHPELLHDFPNAVITPNVVEFRRLWDAAFPEGGDASEMRTDDLESLVTATRALSEQLGGVTILRKGPRDLVYNGDSGDTVDLEGSPRRCGGQGDILSGLVATFLAWAKPTIRAAASNADAQESRAGAAVAAAAVVRRAGALAYEKKGRAMLTSDILAHVGEGFYSVFGREVDEMRLDEST